MSTLHPLGPLPRLRRLLANGLPVRLVFYGDSISEVKPGWQGGASTPERIWCALVADAVRRAYPTSSVSVHPAGIGGQNTYEGLGRLHELAALQPDLVLVAFGANDCSHHDLLPAQTGRALQELATAIPVRTGADVVVIGCGGDDPARSTFGHLAETVSAQRAAAHAAGCPFVDMHHAMLDATAQGRDWALHHVAAGNCHPNDRGHAAWATAAWAAIATALAAPAGPSPTRQHRLTPQPPRGWNSYDSFGCFINERRAFENLRVFTERLLPHGYDTFAIDAGWYRIFTLEGREFPHASDPYTVLHDAWGRPVPWEGFFPRGLRPLAEACHAAGVKFGLHLMRGIPRAAVAANTPILGTPYRAADIADPTDTCAWCPDMFGVDLSRPGAQAYYDSIIDLVAAWGVDFIKYDDIVPSPPEVAAVTRAIARCPRDIVLSLSPGNGHHADGWDTYLQANLVRTSGDIWDSRDDFRWVFQRWQEFMPLQHRIPHGCWLDMDMIPFGELQVWNPSREQVGDILMNGKGAHRKSALTAAQQRTFLTMRALGASPLIMGGNLPGTDDAAFALLTDAEMLACNANGVIGRLIAATAATCTWLTPHRADASKGWFALFNRDGERPQRVVADAARLGLPPASRCYDIWNRRELGDLRQPITADLLPDEVLFVRYGG